MHKLYEWAIFKTTRKPKIEKLGLIGLNDCYVVSLGEEEFF